MAVRSAPIPNLVDGAIRLSDLERWAQAFDEISDEDLEGARFSASTFVGWLRLDLQAGEQRANPGRWGVATQQG